MSTRNGGYVQIIFPFQSPAYLDFLSSPVYSIIPKSSFDLGSGKLRSQSNTFGTYYIASNAKEMAVLKMNRNNWRSKPSSPDEIRFLRMPPNVENGSDWAVDALRRGQIDYIGFEPGFSLDNLELLKKNYGDQASFAVTDELNVNFMLFTAKGMELPVKLRQIISKKIHESVDQKRQKLSSYRRPTVELMVPGSYGSLSKDDQEALMKLRQSLKESLPKGKKITIGYPSVSWVPRLEKYLAPLKDNISLVPIEPQDMNESINTKLATSPDLVVFGWDLSYRENYTTIALMLRRGIFNLRGDKANEWIQKYFQESDTRARSKMFHDLHFSSVVTNPSVIPLYTVPYRAVALNGWALDKFSQTAANINFWEIYNRKNK